MNLSGHQSRYPDSTPETASELRGARVAPWRMEPEAPSPGQVEFYRRMTPGRRLELAEQLYWTARRLKRAWVRSAHPEWTEPQVEAEVTRNFSHA